MGEGESVLHYWRRVGSASATLGLIQIGLPLGLCMVGGSITISPSYATSDQGRVSMSEMWLTVSIAFHSLLITDLISPTPIVLVADSSGLRVRAKIVKPVCMGCLDVASALKAGTDRLGGPPALRGWVIRELTDEEPFLSSIGTGFAEQSKDSKGRDSGN